ncbi:hypothetical protein ACJMK2_032063 [Sinanodonta woodiana]|uniref:C-type lectin domain-containing protein n=1 Tax=Sinanodonta woodiana TaxID=1069815 RepID=A0ABD3X166_SINWO
MMNLLISLILSHQLLTQVSNVNSQNTCKQTSVKLDDYPLACGNVNLFFDDAFSRPVVQLDDPMKDCPEANKSRAAADEQYQALSSRIADLEKRIRDVGTSIASPSFRIKKPTCPDGYQYYYQDHFCYKFHSACKTWSEARQTCRQEGGDLLWLKETNFDFFRDVSRSHSGACSNVWVGATDVVSEGQWYWVNGDKVRCSFWQQDEPDNSQDNENCANLLTIFDYKLNDQPCQDKESFICQIV